jgi:hypothetical protein
MHIHKIRSILLWIVLALVLLLAAFYVLVRVDYLPTPGFMLKRPAPMPTAAGTRDGRWQQAVSYLGNVLPQLHVNPYFKISEAVFQQSVTDLAENVPNLNDAQMNVEIMRIVASLGDGHTRAFSIADAERPARLPLEMRWFSDGLVVIAASPEYEEAVGAQVVQIGTHPLDDVYEAVKPLNAADNEMQILNDTPIYMGMPTILYGLDLIPDQDRVTFRFEAQDESQFDLELRPLSGDAEGFVSIYEEAGVPRPLYEQNRQAFYWVQDLPESNAVYVQYNACREQEGKPFESFVEEVFALVDRSPDTRLVLDLRFNGGGDQGVITPFIEAIKTRPMFDQPGKLFVIIGRGTYSSALQNAITLSREYNATLVGEPTGGKPNQYGEVRHFDLPNVGIRVNYSTHYWRNYPKGDPLSLEPDIPAVVTIADLLAGRDPALEIALQRE